MRRKAIAVAGVLGLAALVAWLVLRGGSEPDQANAGLSDDQIVAKRRTARRSGQVDLRPAAVTGRVVDADTDAGIAGAVVSLTERSLDGGARGRPGESPEPLTAITDDRGQFRIGDLRPGRYSLAATAADHAPALLDPVDLAPGDERGGVVLRLGRGGHALTGAVTDIGGGPVAGALVRAKRSFEGSITALFRAPFTTTTDDAGRYALQLADGEYEVTAQHVDYVAEEATIEIRGGPREEDFRLVPGGVIEGKVVAREGGEPVAGALVTEAQEQMMLSGVAVGARAAITDDQGRFTLRGLESGAIQLQAIGRGYTTREPTLVELGIGEHVDDVVIYADKAYTVSGFVVDKDDRSRAVPGVLVGAYNLKPGALLMATDPSAEDGYFEILGVPPGSYFVGAIGEQRVPTVIGPSITIEDRDIDDVVVELDIGATVSGRVEPPMVADISVSFDMQSAGLDFAPMISAMISQTRSDESGRFELRGIARGRYSIVARADDGREGETPVQIADADVADLVIRLAERARVSGIVVDAAGAPLANARVSITPKKQAESFKLGARMIGEGGALTHRDGRFEERGLPPGTHQVKVLFGDNELAWAGGDRAPADPKQPIEIDIEGTTPITGLRLVVEARNKQIRGLVIGPDGAPAQDAWVTARYWDAESAKAKAKAEKDEKDDDDKDAQRRERWRRWAPSESPVLTGDDGRFAIDNLRDGNYDLDAEGARGAASGRLEAVRVGADVVIRMQSLASVGGVVRRGGNPVEQYSVSLQGPTSRRRAVANRDGRYEFLRVEPGSYEVAVTAADGRASAKIDVAPDRRAERDLELVDYSRVTGVVVDAQTGKPMAGYAVMAYSEGGDPTDMLDLFVGGGPKTDRDGRFQVGRLGAGEGTLMVLDGDRNALAPLASKKFVVGPGQELDLGTIHGSTAGVVPRDERGELGLVVTAATWKARPGASRGDGSEPPAGTPADAEFLWVSEIEPKAPAAEAGLEVGDRIVAIDGLDLATVGNELAQQMLSSLRTRAGESRTVAYERAGRRSTATIEARPLPPG